MAARLVLLFGLSLLSFTEANKLHSRARARLKQVPIQIPILVPLDAPLMDGVEAEEAPTGGAMIPAGGSGGSISDIFNFLRTLGAPGGESGRPRNFPLPADGLRIRMRPGDGGPTPLHVEQHGEHFVVAGQLPTHLSASSLKVKQLGNLVTVRYLTANGVVGVEQQFQFDFEPQEAPQAKYSGTTGAFSLDITKPQDAGKPREVVIAFEDAPADKVEAATLNEPSPKANKAAARFLRDRAPASNGFPAGNPEGKGQTIPLMHVRHVSPGGATSMPKAQSKDAKEDGQEEQKAWAEEEQAWHQYLASVHVAVPAEDAQQVSQEQAADDLKVALTPLQEEPLILIEVDNS